MTIGGVAHANDVTGCDLPPIAAVRDRLQELADRARPKPSFSRFVLSTAGGPCPPSVDCAGFVELTADGTLRVDRMGELPAVVHEGKVSGEELEAAIAVLTAPALVALLDLGQPACLGPTDLVETMRLESDGHEHANETTGCADPPLEAARSLLRSLADGVAP